METSALSPDAGEINLLRLRCPQFVFVCDGAYANEAAPPKGLVPLLMEREGGLNEPQKRRGG